VVRNLSGLGCLVLFPRAIGVTAATADVRVVVIIGSAGASDDTGVLPRGGDFPVTFGLSRGTEASSWSGEGRITSRAAPAGSNNGGFVRGLVRRGGTCLVDGEVAFGGAGGGTASPTEAVETPPTGRITKPSDRTGRLFVNH
jgi:hypothetical protein